MHRSHSTLTVFTKNYSPTRVSGINKASFSIGEGPELHRASTFYANLVDDRGASLEPYRKSEEELKAFSKKIRTFYQTQNDQLDAYKEVDEVLDDTITDTFQDIESSPLLPRTKLAGEADATGRRVKWAININLIINVLLLGGKIGVVLLSNSVSLVASTIDSAMDLLSTLIIAGTALWVASKDWRSAYNYPTGKYKLEPLGIIVFSVFIIASFMQVLIESVSRLSQKHLEPVTIPLSGLIIMWTTIGIKFIVWIFCRNFKSPSVRALAQDAENDVVFNFFSLLFPWLGAYLQWPRLDPLGGCLLSVYIIIDWSQTLYENVVNLAGRRASNLEHNRVVYLVTRFSPLIKAVQHVSCYHVGDPTIVEVDIIIPQETPLTLSHNLGESIQMSLESLDNIARAYVHVDFQPNKATGHKATQS